MRSFVVVVFIAVGFFSACQKDNTISNPTGQTDTILIIGDPHAHLRAYDTVIHPPERCDSVVFELDIDSTNGNDFRFYTYYCYSPKVYTSHIRIDCLDEKYKVLCDSELNSPVILEKNDTLTTSGHWMSGKIGMLSRCGYDGNITTHGVWHDLSNKYIGVMIEKENNALLGWIKVSMERHYTEYPIQLHETAYQKIAYIAEDF